MKKERILILICTLALGVFFAYRAWLLSWSELDMRPLAEVASTAVADLVVIRRDDPVRSELLRGRSVAGAVAQDPKTFKEDLALVHTYMNGILVAEQAADVKDVPFSSARFRAVLKDAALDHWGRPYCVTGNAESLVLISSGQNQKEIRCGGTVAKAHLDGVPRGRLIKTDAGYLTLIVDRQTLTRTEPQRR